MSRLLGTTRPSAHRVANDDEAWAVRLGALASLGQFDALALVVAGPAGLSRSYNLGDPSLDASVRAAVVEAERTGAIAQVRTSQVLADGRMSGSALVAPLILDDDGGTAAVIAYRVGRPFGAVDAMTATSVGELVTVELVREVAARRDAVDRRQALTLYELARLALFVDDLPEALQGMATLLAGNLAHDMVQLWSLRPSGSLRLLAAHPEDELPLEIARPADHEPLGSVVESGEIARIRRAARRSWVPDHIADLIVAPLLSDVGPLGVLVLGRARDPYGPEDEGLAGVLGSFIGRLLAREGPAELTTSAEWEDEPEASRP